MQSQTVRRPASRVSGRTIVMVLAVIGASVSVSAAPISFQAQAQVFRVENDRGLLSNFLPTIPMIDDIISLTLTFDPDTVGPVTFPAPGNFDIAFYPGGVPAATLTAGGVTLTSVGGLGQEGIIVTPLGFDEIDPFTRDLIGIWDGYGFTAGADGPAGSDTRWGMNLGFVGGDIDDISLPDSIPFLDMFEGAGVGFRSFDTAAGEVFDSFSAEIIDVQAIPLPVAVWLFVSALGLLGATCRRSAILPPGSGA